MSRPSTASTSSTDAPDWSALYDASCTFRPKVSASASDLYTKATRENLRRSLLRSGVMGSSLNSLKSIESILYRCDPENTGEVDRDTFLDLMAKKERRARNHSTEYRKAFATPVFRGEAAEEIEKAVLSGPTKAQIEARKAKKVGELLSLLRDEIEMRYGFHTLQRGFLAADYDGNGSLSPSELKRMLLRRNFQAGPDSVLALVEACDTCEKDGKISFEEFVRVVRGQDVHEPRALLPGPPLSSSSDAIPGWNAKSAATGRLGGQTVRIFPSVGEDETEKRTEAAAAALFPPPPLPKPSSSSAATGARTTTPPFTLPSTPRSTTTSASSVVGEGRNGFQDLINQVVTSPGFRRNFRYRNESIAYENLRQLLSRRFSPLVSHMPTVLRPLLHKILARCRSSSSSAAATISSSDLITYAACVEAVARATSSTGSAAVLSREWDPSAAYKGARPDPRTPPTVRAPWALHVEAKTKTAVAETEAPIPPVISRSTSTTGLVKTVPPRDAFTSTTIDRTETCAAISKDKEGEEKEEVEGEEEKVVDDATDDDAASRFPIPPTYEATVLEASRQHRRTTNDESDPREWAESCLEDLRDRISHRFDWVQRAFVHYDRDRSGRITSDELLIILRALNLDATEEELKALLDLCDQVTKDGLISFEEFAKVIKSRTTAAEVKRSRRSEYERQFKAPLMRSRHDRSMAIAAATSTTTAPGTDAERKYRPMFDSKGRKMFASIPRHAEERRPMFDSRGRKKYSEAYAGSGDHALVEPSCLPGRGLPEPTQHESIFGCYAERNLRYLRKGGENGYGSRVVRPRFPVPPTGGAFATESQSRYQNPTDLPRC
eukprot:g2555.t1